MLGKLTSFITNLSRTIRGTTSPKIELYSCESLVRVNARLAKGGCPHCEQMTSFEPMGSDEQSNSFMVCRTCGLRLVYDSTNTLIGTAGFVQPQYRLYLDRLAREAEKRTALIEARKRDAYRHYERIQVADNPMADKVLQEVESMEAREALTAYMADKSGENHLRKAA